MAQIPMTPGRSRMPGTPNLRTGTGMVSPEDMGSRQFGDWMKLASAVGQAGQEQMRWAIGKYNERADAEARTALAAYSKEMGTLRTQILSTTGSNSFNAAKEMEEYSRMKSEAMAKTLTTPLAKDMFNRARLDYDRQNVEAATRHTLREQERYRQTAIVADNDSLLNDAVMNADNGMVIAGNIQKMKANNAQLYAGMPQEFIDMENRKSAALAAEKVAGAIAVGPGGPQAALNFLNSGIEQEIGDGDLKVKFDALRAKYMGDVAKDAEKQAVDAGTREAVTILDNGGSMKDVYLRFLHLYGPDVANQVSANAGKFKDYADEVAEEAKAVSKDAAVKAGRAAGKMEGMTREKLRDLAFADYDDEKEREAFLAEAGRELEAKGKDRAAADEEQKLIDAEMERANAMAGVAVQEMARRMKDAGFSDQEIENQIRVIRPQAVEQGMKAAAEAEKTNKATRTAMALQREQQLDQEFDQAGGIAVNMPSFRKMSIKEQDRYLKASEEHQALLPDEDLYLQLSNMSDDELNDRWANAEQRSADKKAMGGWKSRFSTEIERRVKNLAKGSKKTEKPDEMVTLDTELNNIKRDIDLSLVDAGRNVSEEERKAIVNRVLGDYDAMLNGYMLEKGLSKVTQVPVKERVRMRAEAILTYEVETPGLLWGTNRTPMTRAEAMAAGISTEGAGIVPGSLPVDLRRNHVGGTVRRIAQANGGAVIADVDIPPDKVPENIRLAATQVGGNPRIVRDLVSGAYMVVGDDRAFESSIDGTKYREMSREDRGRLAQAIRSVAPQGMRSMVPSPYEPWGEDAGTSYLMPQVALEDELTGTE